MKNKYKITGFARLLIFLLLFAPIAYIGASYYQGEDGIENIKSIFRGISTENKATMISNKKKEIKILEEKLNVSKRELSDLENNTQ